MFAAGAIVLLASVVVTVFFLKARVAQPNSGASAVGGTFDLPGPGMSQANGTEPANAIVLNVVHEALVPAEMATIARLHGTRNVDWFKEDQELKLVDGRLYDVITIRLAEGGLQQVWFDVNEPFAARALRDLTAESTI
ncbi:MAG: hypothetical protein HQL11_05020 [Candidatus Omnitrophica bacterium]|nr:hypothetical protein [Candidatus Omnitrophota bacterium]